MDALKDMIIGTDGPSQIQTEACTYNTAPLVGVFARLIELEEQKLEEEDVSLVATYKR